MDRITVVQMTATHVFEKKIFDLILPILFEVKTSQNPLPNILGDSQSIGNFSLTGHSKLGTPKILKPLPVNGFSA